MQCFLSRGASGCSDGCGDGDGCKSYASVPGRHSVSGGGSGGNGKAIDGVDNAGALLVVNSGCGSGGSGGNTQVVQTYNIPNFLLPLIFLFLLLLNPYASETLLRSSSIFFLFLTSSVTSSYIFQLPTKNFFFPVGHVSCQCTLSAALKLLGIVASPHHF